jgi:hypothetical protein
MPSKTKVQLMTENLALQARLVQREARLADGPSGKDSPSDFIAAERPRVEKALRASEVRYRRLFETAKNGILILTASKVAFEQLQSNEYILYEDLPW